MQVIRAAGTRSFGRSISTNVNTVNAEEIALFSRLSSLWWDERGEFGMLHKMNPVRMNFIRDKLRETQLDELPSERVSLQPLEGLQALDVGCGGGLLSEVSTGTVLEVTFILNFCRVWHGLEHKPLPSMLLNQTSPSQLHMLPWTLTSAVAIWSTFTRQQSRWLNSQSASMSCALWRSLNMSTTLQSFFGYAVN